MNQRNFVKGLFILFTLAAGLSASAATPPPHPFGLGIVLFGPTGVSGNYFLDNTHSIDGALAWSSYNSDQSFYLHSDYLFHKPDVIKLDKTYLDAYFGAGLRIIHWTNQPGNKDDGATYFGVRAVAGTNYRFKDPDIEVFGELSVNMDKDTDFRVALGGRYYF